MSEEPEDIGKKLDKILAFLPDMSSQMAGLNQRMAGVEARLGEVEKAVSGHGAWLGIVAEQVRLTTAMLSAQARELRAEASAEAQAMVSPLRLAVQAFEARLAALEPKADGETGEAGR